MAENEEKTVAEKIDARVEVSADSDGKSAYIVIHAPQNNGADITMNAVLEALQQNGAVYGIDTALLEASVEAKAYEMPIKAAEYTAPRRGANGYIEYKFDKEHTLKPQQDEFGIANYRELNSIVPIRKNEIIADIIMPEDGVPGISIFGKPIAAEPGVPAKVILGKNTLVTLDGKNIVSACDGHIVYGKNCFIVEEAVIIKTDLDISVGNISFFGDVHIRGNVMEGFSVNAGKNVKIDGCVFGGQITAGGNVKINGGCLNSKVECEGDCDIGFCENSSLSVKGDLSSKQFAFCNIFCYGGVTAKGNRGVIVGGKITSMHDVKAGIIGSDKYTPTEIFVGDGSVLFKRKRDAEADLNESERIFDMTIKNLSFLKQRKIAQGGNLTNEQQRQFRIETQNKLFHAMRKAELKSQIEKIDEDIRQKDNLQVICSGSIFPGVKICINFMTLDVVELSTRCRAAIVKDSLEIIPL